MIWGAGSIGQSEVLIDILNLEYDIIGYYDGDAEKWGKSINKLQVFSQQDFQEKCKSGNSGRRMECGLSRRKNFSVNSSHDCEKSIVYSRSILGKYNV